MKILFGSDVSFEYKDGGITPENASERVSSVKPVFDAADFRMVNLENVLYDSQEGEIIKSGPALRSSRSCVSFLKALGIDTVGLANNHFGDFGDRGMSSTLECLEQNGISYVGAGKNIDEAYRSHVFEKDGISVSVIASCENEFGTASAECMGSAGYEPLRLANRISEEKKRADFVVVYFHGGNERDPYPSPGKNDLYRLWTRLGADAVIAMHTHCPQGFEIFEEKPIVYSMGNLYFPGEPESYAAEPDSSWFFGYLTELDFSENGISVKTYPYRFGSVNEPLLLLSGSEKETFDRYFDRLCAPISNRSELVRLFKIWCTMAGIDYSHMVNFSSGMLENGSDEVKHLRNIFRCEAHNELISVLVEMCYKNEVGKYSAFQQEIKNMQHIDFKR